jgi:hypothetical protein
MAELFNSFRRWLSVPRLLTVGQEALARFVALAVIGSVTAAMITAFNSWYAKPREIDLAERIKMLTSSLNSTARTITQIEDEIKRRQVLVERLKQNADTASKLAAMNKEQADAVAQTLRVEIEKENQKSFWSSQMLAIGYTVLGVALAELYRFCLRVIHRRRLQKAQLAQGREI